MRDLLRSQGDLSQLGLRDTLRAAFRLRLISNGDAWMLMNQDCNLTTYTYNRATAQAICPNIIIMYFPCFQGLRQRLRQRLRQEQQ